MKGFEAIAQRGASVLVRVDAENAQILDMRHERLFPPQSIEAALARGYWKEFDGDAAHVEAVFRSAELVSDPPTQFSARAGKASNAEWSLEHARASVRSASAV